MIDAILSHQRQEDFQVWKLKVNKNNGARLSMEDGNDNELVVQIIEFTDFPLSEITMWLVNDVLLLPSEY